jgi:SpoVK/Ycf46/Vps4 family AAA+-type ATPase
VEILLNDAAIEGDRNSLISRVAKATETFSGSDLKELCRNAVMLPVRERLRSMSAEEMNAHDTTVLSLYGVVT